MVINKGTLGKEVDSEVHLIYPKTSADMVEYDSTHNMVEKIAEVEASIPSTTSELENNSGYITQEADALTNYYDKTTIDNKFGGTVEITSGEPEKENTVLILDPNSSGEEVTMYSVEEIDEKFDNAQQQIDSASSLKKERPDDGIVQITVAVDGKEDYGVLYLPSNYSKTGDPVQLVINCHGAGAEFTASSYALGAPGKYLPDFGYAVCDINANLNERDVKGQHWGDPYAIKSYLALYDYVTKNYNVTKEVFIMGTSMGGTTSNYLVNLTSIPVKAQAGFCTVVDIGKTLFLAPPYSYTTIRSAINSSFEFSDFEFTNAAIQCTQEEFEHFVENKDKLTGYNPIQFNCINWNAVNPYEKALRGTVTDATWQESRDDEATRYNQLISTHKCPIKIWHCADDATTPYRYSKYYIDALKRGGCYAEYREFTTGNHNAYDNAEYTEELIKIDGTLGTYNASTVEVLKWFERWK